MSAPGSAEILRVGRTAPERLEALTSLRFFAAAMIVLLHAQGVGMLPAAPRLDAMLFQGVTFFFVLSGFILHHVHPNIPGCSSAGRFLLARFARVWPGHFFALLLVVALFPAAWKWNAPSLANLTMVHAWIPYRHFVNSLNIPSWSVSTEWFFYLCFPLLIKNFGKSWHWKLFLAIAASLGLVAFSVYAGIPPASTSQSVGLDALIYTNPAARIFQFVTGMSLALAWRRWRDRVRLGRLNGTLVECTALALAIAAPWMSLIVATSALRHQAGMAGYVWLMMSGGLTCLPFALFIAVVAHRQGLLSKILGHPLLMLLGEISYAIYLIHFPILQYYLTYLKTPLAGRFAPWQIFLVYSLLLLVASYVFWRCLEKPCRKLLLQAWPRQSLACFSKPGMKEPA